jgi:hypothetical protein
MMAVDEHDLDEPPTIVAPLHGQQVPMVEIAGQLNGSRRGHAAIEMDRPERMPRMDKAHSKYSRF